MKINILNIPEEGLRISFSIGTNELFSLLPEAGKLDFSLHQVDVSCYIREAGDNIFIKGNMETVMEAQCSRCLEEAHLPLKAEFSYTLLPEAGPVKEEIELKGEDLEVGYYSGEVVDLVPLVLEQILLQAPMKALCEESCKGLCPHCGINLNRAGCNCRSDFVDARLAVLKNFRVQ